MGRVSTIKKLPKKIREKIGKLRSDGRTIDEIMEKLSELNVDVSRSALGRHCKELEQISKTIRESRIIAEAIAKELGDKDSDKVTRVNIEFLHSVLTKAMAGSSVNLSAKDAMLFATALQKLTQASKQDVEREVQIRKEIINKASKAVDKAGKKEGLSSEVIEKIKNEFLGIS